VIKLVLDVSKSLKEPREKTSGHVPESESLQYDFFQKWDKSFNAKPCKLGIVEYRRLGNSWQARNGAASKFQDWHHSSRIATVTYIERNRTASNGNEARIKCSNYQRLSHHAEHAYKDRYQPENILVSLGD